MTDSVTIRRASNKDRDQILMVEAAATRGPKTVDLIERIWRTPGYLPSFEFVAIEGTSVVGHILYSIGQIGTVEVPGLAPLAVTPSRQNGGIGSQLVRSSLGLLETAGYLGVIVSGRPSYYGRFGFDPASGSGIGPTNPEAFDDLDAFMVKRLTDAPLPIDPSLCQGVLLRRFGGALDRAPCRRLS